ncbi:putative carboxylesterase 18 [Citrus sinensis]|uniref:Carboxylesterase 18 n=1 Tax=Citrus sinensis TaxID=2711 RepID=A0ACB8M8L3_CITSI|nr:putative carboxylesterase 18 [Citrus sinensis]
MSNNKPSTCADFAKTWKMKLTVFVTNLVMKFCCRSDGTVNRRLVNFLDFKVPPSVKPLNGVKTYDIIVDASRNLCADSLPYDTLCRRLVKELSAVVISVNYRLSPEFKYPCQYEDGFDVLTFIECNPSFEGIPRNANLMNCFIGGDSAGGNIAHHVAVKACDKEFTNLKINGVIAIQPGFFGQEKTESEIMLVRAPFLDARLLDCFVKAFLPEGSDRDHPAANVFGPNSVDISGLKFPATIVIVGGIDPLKDRQKRYYQGLKKYGKEAYLIEYPNAFHSFYTFPEVLESSLMINEVRDFMQKQSTK